MFRSKAAALLFAVHLAIILAAPPAGAAQLPRGTSELFVDAAFAHNSFSYRDDSIGSTTQLDLGLGVGYCVSDVVELGGAFTILHAGYDGENGDSDSATAAGLQGSVTLNIATRGATVPYVSAELGVVDYSGSGATSYALPVIGAGIRFLVGNSASLNVGAHFVRLTNAQGREDLDATSLQLGAGVSLFPGGIDDGRR